jgi:3-hydroxybutyrate dehydrogenase
MRLHNKSALITGAGSGIGRAIAQEFAREGAKVAIADIDLAAATQAAGEIQSRGGIAIAVQMDVANETQVDEGTEFVSNSLDGLDILVSNAGIQIINPIGKSCWPYTWTELS